ncbi:MAG TPA: RNA polymerase sigma factor [Eubacteriaceae bacterium]|mgnify:CR=1 FL=1|jgi:RNA polymerase sigma-70 factor (ECF subfamily)|nr:RNA polymerase sigma factor [Eubacteriaceae bacterium]
MDLEERIHSIQRGDISQFEWIVEEYKNKIFSLAYGYTKDSYLAQDLTQDIFVRLYKNINSFQGQSSFSTWLYRVAKNQCIDWTRRNKKRMENTFLEEGQWDFKDLDIGPEERAIRKEKNQLLYEALESLPEKYRTPLMLFHFQNLSYGEIAEVLDLPSKTVATHLYRGKKLLREKLISKGRGDMLWTALL